MHENSFPATCIILLPQKSIFIDYSSRRETSSDSIQRLQVYYNYDQEEVALNPDLDVTTQERIVKVLAEFREGGGRYKYKEESHSHFMIKHWLVGSLVCGNIIIILHLSPIIRA